MDRRTGMIAACYLLVGAVAAHAAGPSTPEARRAAVVRGLEIVERAARNYPEHRGCFACHHQTLPMMAMTTARERGVTIDTELLDVQADFTYDTFSGRIDSMREGKGVGGKSMTIAYALWALDVAGDKTDETTDGMVTYLLKTQQESGEWIPSTHRPPLEESRPMNTVLAAYYLDRFVGDEERSDADEAIARAKAWLLAGECTSQEDRNGRLWGLTRFGAEPAEIESARDAVLAAQRDDGGWSQLDDMESDAYATGQTLYVLSEIGMEATEAAYDRGVEFLLRTQEPDGSWFVQTRSKPIQVFFDNGDPHGKSQFISIAATSWSVAALARTLPRGE